MKDSISVQLQKILKSAERDGGERAEVIKFLSELKLSLEEVRVIAGKDKLVLQEISEEEAKKIPICGGEAGKPVFFEINGESGKEYFSGYWTSNSGWQPGWLNIIRRKKYYQLPH